MFGFNKFFQKCKNNWKTDIDKSKKNMKIQQTGKIWSLKSLQNLKSYLP